ncbi:hypothetical protein PR202_gb23031 [Eleusine coracana subsp. coracana]|uniref:Inositol-tetrakisphosphate 1-kinase 6 n=1 Tax=Eleusine coracana subsp. coracana TaxID=191504 RepID=A0AAV5FH90_ELECO|nr:hypothetical protein PR202_gb23031 [Eleusine coracana subsp. coracana]
MAMEGRPVRLVLDSSVLLEPSASAGAGGGSGEVALRPGAEALLRRLRYSNLGVAICYPEGNQCSELIKDAEVFKVSRLQELLLTLATLIKREICSSSVFVVGYLMKQSREEDFAKACFYRIWQLQEVDMVLHKVTDEVVKIDPNSSVEFPKGISFSAGMSEIIRPVPVLKTINTEATIRSKCRSPVFKQVNNFHDGMLEKQVAEANLSFPFIVKPQVACGVADAHNMALVFKFEEFCNLTVPLPAVLQEYIDHGSKIFKFYVIGDKVFHAVKTSMPNASFLKSSSGGEPLTFNSLKTLPVATKEQLLETRVQDSKLDTTLVEEAAKSLKDLLGLTIFGFDVVVQDGTGDHVIVDLNYLPSFKEVPDTEAVPAFWDAIRMTYQSKRGKSHT